jgi:hypothetical protein
MIVDLLLAGCAVALAGAGIALIRIADRWLPGIHCDICYGLMPGGWARFARRSMCEECAGVLTQAADSGQYPIARRAASNARIAGLTDQAVRDAIARKLNWDRQFKRNWDSLIGLNPPGDAPDE